MRMEVKIVCRSNVPIGAGESEKDIDGGDVSHPEGKERPL
jgi:hypothetical protein